MFFFLHPFHFKFHRAKRRLVNSEREITFHLLWSGVYILKKIFVKCVWHQLVSVFKHDWGISGYIHFWEVLTLFLLTKLFLWTYCRSAEDGSGQTLFMVSQWTSWAPRDWATQFDFHHHVDSNYTTGSKATIKRGSWKWRYPVKWWRGYVPANKGYGVKPALD